MLSVGVEAHPDPADVAYLEQELHAGTVAAAGMGCEQDLVVTARSGGELIGGCCGITWGGTCQLDTLWVRPGSRGTGLGRRLLEGAEREAGRRGCGQVVLFTHDFQAGSFYRRAGYEVVGRVDGYPAGHAALWMRKELAGPGGGPLRPR